jgi:hypothetical protein
MRYLTYSTAWCFSLSDRLAKYPLIMSIPKIARLNLCRNKKKEKSEIFKTNF